MNSDTRDTGRPTVAVITLGCKVNQYESDGMKAILEQHGYTVVGDHDPADVTVVNTCAVTNMAERKSRQMMTRAKRLNPDTVLVACGCYVQAIEKTLNDLPEVDIFLGNNEKEHIAEFLSQYLSHRKSMRDGDLSEPELPEAHILDIGRTESYENFSLVETGDRGRAYIKVQDGCNQFCSYCLIPYVRGRVRSRDMKSIISEAERLSDAGYHEIVLTGIHISSYGTDFADGTTLLTLLRALDHLAPATRIRLGSLEPSIITKEFADALTDLRAFCPHFHLSLQSGCDTVLKRMNRHYTSAQYREKCEILRDRFHNPAITTDVIVGFPGETDEEFQATYDYLRDLQLYETHIFKFSPRSGTLAEKMPDQVDGSVKHRRSEALISLGRENRLKYEDSFEGKTLQLLTEESVTVDGVSYIAGHTENYIHAALPYDSHIIPGEVYTVTMTAHHAGDLALARKVEIVPELEYDV